MPQGCSGTRACDDAPMPVLVAAGVCGLVVLAAYAGLGVLTLAAVGAQLVLAYGLSSARGLPDRQRSGVLVAVTGVAAVAALRLAEPEPSGPTVAPVVWVLGPAVVLALLLELSRRDGRPQLVESLAATLTGIGLVGLLALLVPLQDLAPLNEVGVALAAVGTAVGVAVWWLCAAGSGRWRVAGWVAATVVVVAAVVALAVVALPDLTSTERSVIGSAAAVTGLVGAGAGFQLAHTVVGRAALMPVLGLALSTPAAYLAQRLLFW